MRRTVVLRHVQDGLPDHFDWLIDQPERTDEHRLITFRCEQLPTQARKITAAKAPDHRAVYLDYEGDLSQGRGHVTRVLRGVVTRLALTRDTIECEVDWEGHSHVRYVGAGDGTQWVIAVH